MVMEGDRLVKGKSAGTVFVLLALATMAYARWAVVLRVTLKRLGKAF
jgi:hypothetical protein